jgi:hypothetical protein
MPYKIGDLSRGPCCEINKLIVQVVGKDHPQSQRLAFYEKDSSKPLDELTARDNPETVSAWMCKPSSLHVWDWDGEPDHRMVLEVEAEHAEIIRLPLPKVRVTTRRMDRQENQIVPVLPFVALPGVGSANDHGTPVLCRPGYIYVFIDGRLWRELEIRLTGECTTYHDIDLEKFRIGKNYANGSRIATGKALDDIWVPSSWNGARVQAQLCFSEVQLNAPRIHRLENDADLRQRRCQNPDLRVAWDSSQKTFRDKPDGLEMLEAFSQFDAASQDSQAASTKAYAAFLNVRNRAFPLSIPAPQRARQIGLEWMLDQPAKYLCDLSGQYSGNALQTARLHVQHCEIGTEPYIPKPLETGAWVRCLEQICQPDSLGDDELWTTQPATTDVLTKARARELHGVLLMDTQYRLRHLNVRIQDQRYLLQLCAERAQRYPHHGSALLVQQLIAPQRIGGISNPLQHKLDSLEDQGRRDINRFTASSERTQIWRQLEVTQALLCECLQSPVTEQSLADHFSQNGFDYVAALYFVSQLFVTLAGRPSLHDPLAASGDITDATTGLSLYSAKASAGQKWIDAVVNDPQHPVHEMLWPAAVQDMDAPYHAPSEPDVNRGDGSFRGTELASVEPLDLQPIETAATIDSLFLAGLLKNGSLKNTLTVTAKAGTAALVAAAENMHTAVEAASRAVHGAQRAAFHNPDTKPWRLNDAVHRRSLSQMRSMLPQTFGDMRFLPYEEARARDYYVFGLDDVPEKLPRSAQPYGVYRNQHGVLKTPAEESGYSQPALVLPPDRTVIGIPRNHRTALAVSRINKQFNAAWREEMLQRAAGQSERVSALQRATQLRDAAQSSTLFYALDSVPMAGLIAGLELYNLLNEVEAIPQTGREKGTNRAISSVVSAGVDLIIAVEALTVKIAASNSSLTAARKIILTVSEHSAKRFLGPLSGYLITAYSSRMLAQIGAGLIFSTLSISDAWYSYRWNDDAYIGSLIMAIGGLIGAASSVIIVENTLLGLSRLGWVALILIAVGAGIAYALSSTPIEDWLQKGPFGRDSYGVAQYLQDPNQAFYRLTSLLANVRIRIDRNPDFLPDAKIDSHDTVPFLIRSTNTRIRIESNLAGLIRSPHEIETCFFLKLKSFEVHFETASERTRTESFKTDISPLAHRLWPGRLEVFVHTPFSYKAEPAKNLPEVYHTWQVRAQIKISSGEHLWVFPAPPPKDPTVYNSTHVNPDFENSGNLFWIDETENLARTIK